MSFFPNRTTFLSIGSLNIQWYAVLILTGAFIAYFFGKRNLKEYRYIDIDGFFDDVFVWLLWGGVIGARLWFCLFYNFDFYVSNPIEIIKIWDGGLAFHGGFVGGALAAYFVCRKKNVSFIKVLDCLMPTVLIGQAVGRWGNFVNQECHGSAVSADYFKGPLALIKDGMLIGGTYYKPLFLYESLLCLLGFILINFLLRKTQSKRGQLFGAYLIWYGIIRFFIEADRTDSLLIGSLKTAQVTSIIFVIFGLFFYFGLLEKILKKKKPTIIFDLDGTLTDSTGPIIESFRATFEKFGNPDDFTIERESEVLGPPIKEMFEKYFPDGDIEEISKYYREVNKKILDETLEPIKDAVKLVEELAQEGYDLAILTTRAKSSTNDCLLKCGFKLEDFKAIMTLDDVENTKPNPEGVFKIVNDYKLNSDDVIIVGDSTADIKAGQGFGAYTIAFSILEGKRKGIEEAKPNAIIEELMKVKDILNENHYFTYNLK